MAQEAQVHVVSKTNSLEHHTITTNVSHLPALAPDSIRARTRLVSLTANNLTYARHAFIANWWDAFPVPTFLPSPYNDTTVYGIVPVWGYAEITASQITGLEVGMILYGFWPSSTLPVDLQLKPTEPAGHYIDDTPHRQSMWSYYHRYTFTPQSLNLESPSLAAETVFRPLFECAHALNAYVLGPIAVHPAPKTASSPTWPHADLRNAAVISLAASGKTARVFNDAVLNTRQTSKGPRAFLAITSNPSTLSLPKPEPSPIKTRILSYTAALSEDLPSFLTSLSPTPSKILIADFGARNNCLAPLISHLRAHLPTSTAIAVVGVGGEPNPLTQPIDVAALLAGMAAVPERVQMNTSEVREAVVEVIGAEVYFEGVREGWEGFCERGGCGGVKVEVGKGIGEFEEGWAKLCAGEAASVGGLAYLL